MALKTSGTKLSIDGLQAYISGMNAADKAYNQFIKTIGKPVTSDPFKGISEAEKRLTITARSEAQARVQIARAEAAERTQAARAGAQRQIEEERRITAQFRQSQARAGSGGGFGPGLNNFGGAVLGGATAFLGVQSAQQIFQSAVGLDELRGRANSTQIALELLAGGSKQATDAIAQIQSVAPGSTDSLKAAEAAVTILTQKLPSAAISLADIAKFAATVPRISPIIKDSADAIAQLTLFSSSASFARADQLGVSKDDVQQRVKELAAVYPELSEAQLKAAATVQVLNERFAPLQDSLADQVTGWAKLTTAIAEARIELAKSDVGGFIDDVFSAGATLLTGPNPLDVGAGLGNLEGRLRSRISTESSQPQALGRATTFGGAASDILPGELENVQRFEAAFDRLIGKLKDGGPAAQGFIDKAAGIGQSVIIAQSATEANIQALADLETAYTNTSLAITNAALANEDFASKAFVVSPEAGIAAAFQDTAVEIEDLFSRLNELGDIPGVDAARSRLINLAGELASTGQTTDETDAELIALNNTIGNLSAGGAIGELRNLTLAEIEARQEAQALAGAIAGIGSRAVSGLSGLIGRGLINESQANQLNNVIQPQLAAAQSQFASRGLTGPALQFATASAEKAILEPIIGRIEETEQQRLAAAKDTEKAFKSAAGSAEDAADSLRKALESTPGLFGTSDVTQQQLDLAKAGVPQNFADDFVRRLAAEIDPETGKVTDKFDDVSVEQAREALGRIGVEAADDPRAVLAQLQEAWNNSSLFAAKENLSLINKDAVEQNQKLQQQMEDGRKNIYEFFGLAIEDASAAITGGGSGISAAVPLTDEQINKIATDANNAVIATMDAAIAQIVTGAGGGLGLTGKTPEGEKGAPNINELIAGIVTDAFGGGKSDGKGAPNINELLASVVTDAGGGELQTSFADLITPVEDVSGGFQTLMGPLTEFETAFIGLSTSTGNLNTEQGNAFTSLIKTRGELDKLSDSAQGVADKFNKIVNPDAPLPTDPATTAGAGTVGAFALGTRNYPGGTGWGGEAGPEMFMTPGGQMGMIGLRGPGRFSLPRGSVILDAGKTRNMVGGIPTQQIISSPSNVDNRTITNNWNLSVSSLQSTGSIIRDYSLMRVRGAY